MLFGCPPPAACDGGCISLHMPFQELEACRRLLASGSCPGGHGALSISLPVPLFPFLLEARPITPAPGLPCQVMLMHIWSCCLHQPWVLFIGCWPISCHRLSCNVMPYPPSLRQCSSLHPIWNALSLIANQSIIVHMPYHVALSCRRTGCSKGNARKNNKFS